MALMAAGIASAGLTGLAYINAKYQVTKDLDMLLTGIAAKRDYATRVKQNKLSPWFRFVESAHTYATSEAIWTPQRSYTFSEVYQRSCQYAALLQELGATPRRMIALYMQNSPEMVFVWLACWAVGCSPALINYNLTGDALAHTVRTSHVRIVISDADIAHHLYAQQERLGPGQVITVLDDETQHRAFQTTPDAPDKALAQSVQETDVCLMLYTSGTSGYPKACPMRYGILALAMAARLSSGLCTTPGPDGDRWYNCMPLYHGTGGITSLIAACGGVTLCLAKRFSVSNFWKEIRQSRATLFVYVGETARYLLSAPPSPLDNAHHVKVMYGNGMRPDVWLKFQDRFGISTVCEFFAASEGVLVLQNQAKGPFLATAVGHEGGLLRFLFRNKYFAAALDPDTGDIQRDASGRVVETDLSTGGELMYQLENEGEFSGYYGNPEATEKRLARNVRRQGDVFYRAGDALRRDPDGRWFFMDRLGDTFRWKSENVSTTEVSAAVGSSGVREAVVYGVLVPGHDGRAGCARIYVPQGEVLDYVSLLSALQKSLPKYAVPLFLRVSPNPAETTGNNKIIKTSLQKQGINPELVSDQLLWAPPGATEYVEFTQSDYARLGAGQVKL